MASVSSDGSSTPIIIFPVLGALFFFAFIGCAIGVARSRVKPSRYPIAPYQPPRYTTLQRPYNNFQSRWGTLTDNPNRWSMRSGPDVGGNIVSTTRLTDPAFVDPNRSYLSLPSPAHVTGSDDIERRAAFPEHQPRRWDSVAATEAHGDEELPAYSK